LRQQYGGRRILMKPEITLIVFHYNNKLPQNYGEFSSVIFSLKTNGPTIHLRDTAHQKPFFDERRGFL
jgi:hypothetical protein